MTDPGYELFTPARLILDHFVVVAVLYRMIVVAIGKSPVTTTFPKGMLSFQSA